MGLSYYIKSFLNIKDIRYSIVFMRGSKHLEKMGLQRIIRFPAFLL
jgi:hypothetical protein